MTRNIIFLKNILFTSSLLQRGCRGVAYDDRNAYRRRNIAIQGSNDGNLPGSAIDREEVLWK